MAQAAPEWSDRMQGEQLVVLVVALFVLLPLLTYVRLGRNVRLKQALAPVLHGALAVVAAYLAYAMTANVVTTIGVAALGLLMAVANVEWTQYCNRCGRTLQSLHFLLAGSSSQCPYCGAPMTQPTAPDGRG